MNTNTSTNLVPAMRASLTEKLNRKLHNPVIAEIRQTSSGSTRDANHAETAVAPPSFFSAIATAVEASAPEKLKLWTRNADGTCTVKVTFDYKERWRDREKEVFEAVQAIVESEVAMLTPEQHRLLTTSPREFLEMQPRPAAATVLACDTEWVSDRQQVISLTLADEPIGVGHIRYAAIVPNLVQLQRQLDALSTLERIGPDSVLSPLRVLCGLDEDLSAKQTWEPRSFESIGEVAASPLDEFQLNCVRRALQTPHFAVIEGPPGSGKTTVIASVVRAALTRGERIIIVSPTHVAVDNVVEKLTSASDDDKPGLSVESLPVRYASRALKLSNKAKQYWVGPKTQERRATVQRRVKKTLLLADAIPDAKALFSRLDPELACSPLLTHEFVGEQRVVCGTPLGIQSSELLKGAQPGAFDLLIVDEVSKMTLPEFLAIAVYAKRWVVVGDPAQLPPFNNIEENADTWNDLLSSDLEVVCSAASVIERTRRSDRHALQLVVACEDVEKVTRMLRVHLTAVGLDDAPCLTDLRGMAKGGIAICSYAKLTATMSAFAKSGIKLHITSRPKLLLPMEHRASVSIYEQQFHVVPKRERAAASVFDTAFNAYNSRQWCERSGQKLNAEKLRNTIPKSLPSLEALVEMARPIDQHSDASVNCDSQHQHLIDALSRRYLLNTVSVYDLLRGVSATLHDMAPMSHVSTLVSPSLQRHTAPFVGKLERQYRMHPSLSRVPRELFYFGRALHDGDASRDTTNRVRLVQTRYQESFPETSRSEARQIVETIAQIAGTKSGPETLPSIMVITPYTAQERHINEQLSARFGKDGPSGVEIDVCTLDRCQGREADYVFISLVKSRASLFMDLPQRWNVALTRAKEGLFIVGDINAFVEEAARARNEARANRSGAGSRKVSMSVLARAIEAYMQIHQEHRLSA